MNNTIKTLATRVVILALLLYVAPFSALAAGPSAHLEGLVIDPDGRRSAGATVYLFDREGTTMAEAVADRDGIYSIADLPAGEYGMGVQTVNGVVAPVAAPPIRLSDGQLARRDLKLVQADDDAVDKALTANYGFGSWFGGLNAGEKTGLIIGFVALAYLIYEAFNDEDANQATASPMTPASF
jgi:hypothetical protein